MTGDTNQIQITSTNFIDKRIMLSREKNDKAVKIMIKTQISL